jgi:hypothetical protein
MAICGSRHNGALSFPRKRESRQFTKPAKRGNFVLDFVCCAELLKDWIPACAGMTKFFEYVP